VRPFDVLVASHGPVAASLLAAAEMICGSASRAAAVSLEPDDSPESFGERLTSVLDPQRPTLILTDLNGGTPHNVACALARRGAAIRCIAGVNLGLVIEAITSDEELDDALVERLVTAAREAVVDASPSVAAHR
jgi:mannose PTS system EIIA component